jgi:hypothetical protein
MAFKYKIARIASGIEDKMDDLLFRFRKHMNLNDPLQIPLKDFT